MQIVGVGLADSTHPINKRMRPGRGKSPDERQARELLEFL